MPIIEYSREDKTNLIDEMFKENYIYQFKKWQCIQHMKVTGKSLAFDITNIYRNVINPVWAFVIFQTNRINNQQKDNNAFDHTKFRNLWVEVGGKRYAEESLDLDWDSDNYCLAYDVFQH